MLQHIERTDDREMPVRIGQPPTVIEHATVRMKPRPLDVRGRDIDAVGLVCIPGQLGDHLSDPAPHVEHPRTRDNRTERLRELGMPDPINLYRVLANQPDLLRVWVEMAWTLRLASTTPRRLRELMITRGAEVTNCGYEYGHHRRMALTAGVTEQELAELGRWRESARFSPAERSALAFMEAVLEGSVSDAIADELARHFDAAERVELALTAGFYSMVPRVIDALRVPAE